MSARFSVVSMQCARKVIVPSLVVVWAASCAVFPDEAQLPADGAAGAAGHIAEGQAGSVAAGGVGAVNGADGGSGQEAGAGLSGAHAGSESLAGASTGSAGACAMPRQFELEATADTWIESGKPSARHGGDLSLLVTGDPENERRALLLFSLPDAPPGARLLRGTVTLHLESNSDLSLAARHLELSQLEREFSEERTTWNNWESGGGSTWDSQGGDFGAALASAMIPRLTPNGSVSFDITATLEAVWSTGIVPLPLIVREVGDTPTPPAELAFVSRERDALVPELLMEYCP
jgi:hypothetical protein